MLSSREMSCPRPKTQFHHVILLLITLCSVLSMAVTDDQGLKKEVYLSPVIELTPGLVSNKFYFNLTFPKGHIGVKSFEADLVDDTGASVSIHEIYLHHWVVYKYLQHKNAQDRKVLRTDGLCQESVLGHYFGMGSELRKTSASAPDNYAIEAGNPNEIPEEYEEEWLVNIHAIDTRDVVDKVGCTECRCASLNVTTKQDGTPLKPGYIGGLDCCYDNLQCQLEPDLKNVTKKLFLKYTITWKDWDTTLIPLRVYTLDVTDGWKEGANHSCQVEYDINACDTGVGGCVDSRNATFVLPKGGYVIYGVSHQYPGALGATLYGEDQREICTSTPTYGAGEGIGDEAGYVVGMSTCYPEPGSVKISDGEKIVLVSSYNSTNSHTGVDGHFTIWVADQLPTA